MIVRVVQPCNNDLICSLLFKHKLTRRMYEHSLFKHTHTYTHTHTHTHTAAYITTRTHTHTHTLLLVNEAY